MRFRPSHLALVASVLYLTPAVASAETLVIRPGATVSGVLANGEVKQWQLATEAGTDVRISISAPDATLNARLLESSGKSIQESSSIGGTGGAAMLGWLTTGQTQYQLELKMVGKYPPRCDFRLEIEEDRPAQSGDDPATFPPMAAANLILKGQKLIVAKQYREALRLLNEALASARQLNNRRLEAQAHYRIGMAHYYLGDRQPAFDSLQEALTLQRDAHQPYETALTLNNLATVEMLRGACREAVEHLNEALPIREMLLDQRGSAYTLLGLANASYCVGEAQQALDSDLHALHIWRELKDDVNEAETENTLGLVYLQMGDWENSRQSLNAALALWRKTGNRLGAGNSTYNLGLLEAASGNQNAALTREQDALAIFRDIRDQRGTAYTLEAIGEVYGKKGNHAEALKDFEQSRGILQQLEERYEESYLWQALANEYTALARVAEARDADVKALALAQDVGDEQGEAITLFSLAQLEAHTADYAAALCNTDKAIALVEQSRKEVLDPAHRASYLATKRDIYALKVALLMRARDWAGAFETSDAAHARSLLEEISQASPPTLARLSQVQAQLPADGVLIEYLLGNEQSYGWAITAQRLAAFPLPPRREIERRVRQLYDALIARNQHSQNETLAARAKRLAEAQLVVHSAASRLSTILLGSVPAALRKPRLLIVPDGPLYLVPFPVLPLSGRSEIALSPSASLFLTDRATARADSFTPVLIVANPAPSSGSFGELEFSHREAISFTHIVKPSQLEILEKDQASSAAFERQDLSHFGLIHIAAHAVVDMNHPNSSGIILSDGKINARSLMRLNVHARLVTLSACETALGKEIEGEGVMSLSRAFLHAGARTVLSTLWPVDDEATAAFMDHFYAALLSDRMTPSRALRDAQLHMQKLPVWHDPYYWAAFTLQGDWQ